MKDSFKVAKWEIKTIIKNKTFIIMTFFVPIMILIIGGAIGFFSAGGGETEKLVVGIYNQSEAITNEEIKARETETINFVFFENINEDEIAKTIDENNLSSFLFIPQGVIENNSVDNYFKDLQGVETERIKNILNPLITEIRIEQAGYNVNEINNLVQEINIKSKSLNSQGSSNNNVMEMLLPFGFAMLMVFAAIFSGSALMQSIIKEKSNRIVEIILSSINSWDLMMGKVLGYGIIGLIQIIIWSISALTVLKFVFDFSLTSLFTIKIMYMFIFFVLGFVLISAINAIVGSGMKEAQSGSQSTGFMVMIPLIPLYFSSFIVNNPEGLFSYIFTYIPFTSATTMLIRLGFSNPPLLEIIGVMVLLIVANYLFIKLAAKIFRVGMLMYGKNASFKELFKWARSSDF
ncbi:MAG: ABC transporter permease [Halanaerobiales bacterium]|nr:ABC transporter permease [Halanaerobiales bacterium]